MSGLCPCRQELKEVKEEVRRKSDEGQSQAKLLEEEQKRRRNAERILNQAGRALKDLLQVRLKQSQGLGWICSDGCLPLNGPEPSMPLPW